MIFFRTKTQYYVRAAYTRISTSKLDHRALDLYGKPLLRCLCWDFKIYLQLIRLNKNVCCFVTT